MCVDVRGRNMHVRMAASTTSGLFGEAIWQNFETCIFLEKFIFASRAAPRSSGDPCPSTAAIARATPCRGSTGNLRSHALRRTSL